MNTNLDRNAGILTVTIDGDLTSTTAGALRTEMAGRLAEAAGNAAAWKLFRLDLSRANMVDSVGLNFIVTMLKAVQAQGGKMEIVYASLNVHRTLLFTRLDKHVTLVNGNPGKETNAKK